MRNSCVEQEARHYPIPIWTADSASREALPEALPGTAETRMCAGSRDRGLAEYQRFCNHAQADRAWRWNW